jgi:nifR3 family TIM-barrel protein
MLKIGNIELKNNLILAPMAGITNLPFRLLVKRMGAGLVYSEMVSSMGLTLNHKKTMGYLKSDQAEKPLAVQIFGARPEIMAKAAQMVIENGADIVDINMGCPVKKVTKTGSGAALLKDLKTAEKIISLVRMACPVPLTVKIRSGWSGDNIIACDIARVVEACGADALTIHARTAVQWYSGSADWEIISRVKKSVNIPVIGNGDVKNARDVFEMVEQTGCDGVMIGRAAAKNPWIFKQAMELENGNPAYEPDLSERRALIMEHYSHLSKSMGDKRAILCMRGLLLRYTKGLPDSSRFREAFSRMKDFKSLVTAMDGYFRILEEKGI